VLTPIAAWAEPGRPGNAWSRSAASEIHVSGRSGCVGRPSTASWRKLMLPIPSSRATRRCCATSFFRKRASGWSFDLISNYIKRLDRIRPDDSAAAFRGPSIVRCTAQRLIWSHDGAVERGSSGKARSPLTANAMLSGPLDPTVPPDRRFGRGRYSFGPTYREACHSQPWRRAKHRASPYGLQKTSD
jgi:hypothetical protein